MSNNVIRYVSNSNMNRYSKYYANRKGYSLLIIAEYVNLHYIFAAIQNRKLSISEYVVVSKISKYSLAFSIQDHSFTSTFLIEDTRVTVTDRIVCYLGFT